MLTWLLCTAGALTGYVVDSASQMPGASGLCGTGSIAIPEMLAASPATSAGMMMGALLAVLRAAWTCPYRRGQAIAFELVCFASMLVGMEAGLVIAGHSGMWPGMVGGMLLLQVRSAWLWRAPKEVVASALRYFERGSGKIVAGQAAREGQSVGILWQPVWLAFLGSDQRAVQVSVAALSGLQASDAPALVGQSD